jgi:fucose permease
MELALYAVGYFVFALSQLPRIIKRKKGLSYPSSPKHTAITAAWFFAAMLFAIWSFLSVPEGIVVLSLAALPFLELFKFHEAEWEDLFLMKAKIDVAAMIGVAVIYVLHWPFK